MGTYETGGKSELWVIEGRANFVDRWARYAGRVRVYFAGMFGVLIPDMHQKHYTDST